MQRRRLLSALGATVLPSAGCVGTNRTGTTERPVTARTTDETTTTEDGTGIEDGTTTTGELPRPTTCEAGESFETADGRTVTVRSIRVQKIALVQTTHLDPAVEPGRQFVVADVTVSDAPHLRDLEVETLFGVVADGERLDAEVRYPVVPPSGDLDRPGALVGFTVPAPLDADTAAVAWYGYRGEPQMQWSVGDRCLDALAHPPEFEVRGFETPDEVHRHSEFDATLTVANVGSGDGIFVAELGATTISDTPEVFVEVPAGETVTAKRTVDPHYPEDADELTVVLEWDTDQLKRTIRIV